MYEFKLLLYACIVMCEWFRLKLVASVRLMKAGLVHLINIMSVFFYIYINSPFIDQPIIRCYLTCITDRVFANPVGVHF